MSSLVRSLLVGLIVAGPLAAAPVPVPAKYDPPTAVGQVASVQTVLDTVNGYVKAFSPDSADGVAKGLADLLGEKGWAGVDTKKPVGLFSYVKPKLEDSYVVLVVPVTTEKEAIDLLHRLGLGVEEEAKAKGVYALQWRGVLPENTPTRMRFHDGHAYIGLNADPDELAPAKLLPVNSLVDEKETALAAVTLHPGRTPSELKEVMDGWWAAGKAGLDQLENQPQRGMPKGFPAFAKACVGWVDANSAALFKDADAVRVRLTADPKTVESAIEVTVTPKAKSTLAADIEKLAAPVPGRFHQLVTKDATGGLTATLGTGTPKEVRQTAGQFLADWIDLYAAAGGEDIQPLFTALGQAVKQMLADGKTDAGFALLGPDKSSNYTLVAAAAVADPAAIEKTVRKMVKDAPKEVQDLVKLDAEKVGEMSVHTLTVPEGAEWVEKMFGKKAVLRLAFGKDAVYVSFGPDGLAQLKRATELKPTDGKRFDIVMNPAKLNKLLEDLTGGLGGGGEGGMIAMLIGKEEGLRSWTGVDVKGGKELKVTISQHRTGLLVGFLGFAVFRVGGL